MASAGHLAMSERPMVPTIAFGTVALVALIPMSQANYLLFHTFVEMLTTAIALGGFVVAWSTRAHPENRYAAKLGIGLLFVGLVTLLHAIAYKGMGVFPGTGANLPTQLWIVSRSLLATSFLVAGLSLHVRIRPSVAWAVFGSMSAAALLTIFVWPVFPQMFAEGSGLTPIKIVMEYVIMGGMAAGAVLLWRGRSAFGGRIVRHLLAAQLTLIAAELSFTLYVDVYGFFNFVGHILTLVGFGLLYAAIVDTGLRRPTALLFHDLKLREQGERAAAASLERANQSLRVLVADLETTNKRLDAATNAKGEFLRNMSHELRTPLNSIIGFSEVLSREIPGPLNDEQARQLEMIRAASHHLLDLVEELLDLSQMEEGELHIAVTEFDACQLADTTVSMVRPLADEKHLELECHLPPGAVVVRSDAVRVEQILLNLLGNAVKYTDSGRVVLDVTTEDGWAEFKVADTGIGIPEDELASCFDVFYRTNDSEARGSGLGLPVSKHLASILGGDIEARSTPGAGSVFTLRIPLIA